MRQPIANRPAPSPASATPSEWRTDHERIVSLQALRFFAAAMVVYCHASILGKTVGYGAMGGGHAAQVATAGVDIFFVISGFVIALTGPLARPRPNGLKFFWRRWSRVAPLYYLVTWATLPFLGAPGTVDGFGPAPSFNLPQLIATVFFWPAASAHVSPYLLIGWTLGFEMVFYTAVALLLLGSHLTRTIGIGIGVLVLLLILRSKTGSDGSRFLTNAIFLEFGFGVVLARFWPSLRRMPRWIGWLFALTAIAAFGAEACIGDGDASKYGRVLWDEASSWRVLVFGYPAAFLVTGFLILDRWFRGPIAEVLARLGDASYSIYLAHILVLLVLDRFCTFAGISPPAWLIVSTGVVLAIWAGVALNRTLEKPLMRFIRNLGNPLRPVPEQGL